MDQGMTRRRALSAVSAGVAATVAARAGGTEPWTTTAPPTAPPLREHRVEAADARLYVTDTGGSGPPVLLAHPVTGSALVWGYQQAAFHAAGRRVIAWSRREHARTVVTGADPGTTADILAIATALGLDRFDLLGSAAGGGVALDFAAAQPRRVRRLVIANSVGTIADPAFRKRAADLRPAPFDALPAAVRELGPSYRAADPAGTALWAALEKTARTTPLGPPPPPTMGWDAIASLAMPVLWLTGDADLFVPPPLLAELHRRLPGSTMAVIEFAGHSAYWERPVAFNERVLDFLTRGA